MKVNNLSYPKVLVAAPNSIHKNYVAKEYFSLIKNLSYPNYDIFIADNSPENSNKELYEQLGIDYMWNNPKNKSTYLMIWEAQNNIRNKFLDGNYSHLMFIETDLLPPRDIIERFMFQNKPVIGAQYFIYKGDESILMNQEIETLYTGGQTRNLTLEQSFMFCDGKTKESYSIGFGCCLIERGVIAKIPFRYEDDSHVKNDKREASHADSFWYADCFLAGIPVYLDTSIIVPHYNIDWNKLKFDA